MQSFQQNHHINFHALLALKLLVLLISHLVACSARIVVDKQTDRQTKYCNPRSACALRVKMYILILILIKGAVDYLYCCSFNNNIIIIKPLYKHRFVKKAHITHVYHYNSLFGLVSFFLMICSCPLHNTEHRVHIFNEYVYGNVKL